MVKADLASPDSLPWDWYGLSANPNMTWEIILKNLDKPWDWAGLSQNPNTTLCIVDSLPNKPWDWKGLSSNTGVFNDKKANLTKPRKWSFQELSNNPALPLALIEKYINRAWPSLFNNEFDYDNNLFEKKYISDKEEMDTILETA